MKWILFFVAVFVGVVAGVVWVVDVGTSIGKDTVDLQDGTQLTVPITEYRDGLFHYETGTLNIETIPLEDIARIRFSTIGKDELDKHEITTSGGKRRRCRVIKYDRSLLTVKDPRGNERTGKISGIARIDFKR